MQVPFSPPDISEQEIDRITEVLRSGWITTGPKTKQFEDQLARVFGAGRVKCFSSATAAMELCLHILGIGPGDEVITCAYTYTASASVIVHVGATPVMVDTLPGSPHIDPAALSAAITERTKAVIPVDLGGIPIDYDAVRAVLADKKALFRPANDLQQQLGRVALIGDCAHSFGALYKDKSVGCYPDFACFSFHAVKNLTTAEGGAAAFSAIGSCSADELYRRFSLLSLHGQDKDALAKSKAGGWEYDIVVPGYKCNMTDLTAAFGLAQLARYEEMLRRRIEIVARYNRLFAGTAVTPLPHTGPGYTGCHHLYIVTVDGLDEATRNRIIARLGEQGISANVHFKPLPLMTAYKNLGFDIKNYPNAYRFYEKEITLPLHTLLSDAQVDYTAAALLEAVAAERGPAC